MSGAWDASIRLVYAVNAGSSSAIDTIANGAAFDVLANIRIGEDLMKVVDGYELFISVRNLSQSDTLLRQHESSQLTPRRTALAQTLDVNFGAGWEANEGDVLDVVATFKVMAGVNANYSLASGDRFVVTA